MSEAKNLSEVETLSPEQAIGLLIQGVKIGQSKGKYVLEEAPVLLEAISAFQVKEGDEPTPKEKQEAALNSLITGVLKAQEGGAYTLEDAAVLSKAIAAFRAPEAPESQGESVEQVEQVEQVEAEEVK